MICGTVNIGIVILRRITTWIISIGLDFDMAYMIQYGKHQHQRIPSTVINFCNHQAVILLPSMNQMVLLLKGYAAFKMKWNRLQYRFVDLIVLRVVGGCVGCDFMGYVQLCKIITEFWRASAAAGHLDSIMVRSMLSIPVSSITFV